MDLDKNNENIYFGININMSQKSWDLTSSLVYVDSYYEDSELDNRGTLYTYYDTLTISYRRYQNVNDLESEVLKSKALKGDIYFRNETNMFGQQANYFIGFSAYHSFENQKLTKRLDQTYESYQTGYGTIGDSVFSEKAGSFDNISQSFSLRSGLVFNKKVDDINFIIGLTSLINYSHGDRNSFNLIYDEIVPGDLRFEEYFYQLELPIYLSYSLTDYIEIYYGYHFAYLRQDYTFTESVTASLRKTVESDNFHDYGYFENSYLGVNLKTNSGLRVQIGFNGSITSYEIWSLSLGYEF